MTKEQIKALIAAKIAGQGTQVDLGGALPTILDAIVDAIPEGGGGNEPYIVQGAKPSSSFDAIEVSPDEFARAKEAYLAGRVVLIPPYDEEEHTCTVIGYSDSAIADEDENYSEGLIMSNNIRFLAYKVLIPQQ